MGDHPQDPPRDRDPDDDRDERDTFPLGTVPEDEGVAGHRPAGRHTPATPPQGWRPRGVDERLQRTYAGLLQERGEERSWFPHLVVRAHPGDRGARPVWPPTPCWLSPDIHLFPASAVPLAGAVDLSRSVLTPTVGEEYTVGVHVWNLGRFPAYGVMVRAWWVEPGFFSGTPDPRYTPHFLGGAFTDLGDRDSGRAHRIVLLDRTWTVRDTGMLHQCLFAVAESAPDPWTAVFDANADRHIAQRNLALLGPADDAEPLFAMLHERLDPGAELGIALGAMRVGRLVGAVAAGAASKGRREGPGLGGPPVFGRPRRVASVSLTRDGMVLTVDREPRQVEGLGQAVLGALGAGGYTGKELGAGDRVRGKGHLAVHLTTKETGFTIGLQR